MSSTNLTSAHMTAIEQILAEVRPSSSNGCGALSLPSASAKNRMRTCARYWAHT